MKNTQTGSCGCEKDALQVKVVQVPSLDTTDRCKSPIRRFRKSLFYCRTDVGHESRRGLDFNSKQKQFDFFFNEGVLTEVLQP